MKVGSFRQLALSAAVFTFAVVSISAQTPRSPNFNRPSNFDAQHYIIRVSFDRSKKQVLGDTTVILKPLARGFHEFELDAVGLVFDSVKLEPSGTPLRYNSAATKVRVTLDREYTPDETISVRFKYSATPTKGVYFVDAARAEQSYPHSAQIWTQGEAEEARHWFPSFDFPSDKATTEEYITAATDETVVGNGEFLGKTENPDTTATWHFKMPVPHSTYLVSFVIGKYARIGDSYGDIPLGYYVYPGKENTARNAFGKTKDMIAVYEDLTGIKFPYNKYDQTIVARFQFGGMENITATTMADSEIFLGDFDFGKEIVVDLVSHELAHSWFGDMVTCRNWAELWLNEGFATYMEAAYREKINGRQDYLKKVRNDAHEFLIDDAITRRRHGLYNLLAGDVDKLFLVSAVTYNKGGAVLHMLRETVGTDAFWKGVNLYLTRHRFSNVESSDLKAAMEEASGKDLGWFFDQWVYHAGAPKLTVAQSYNARRRTLKLTISQTQHADAIVPSVFRLLLEIEVKTSSGTILKDVDLNKRIETISIKTNSRPLGVDIDKNDKVILKTVKMLPLSSTK